MIKEIISNCKELCKIIWSFNMGVLEGIKEAYKIYMGYY